MESVKIIELTPDLLEWANKTNSSDANKLKNYILKNDKHIYEAFTGLKTVIYSYDDRKERIPNYIINILKRWARISDTKLNKISPISINIEPNQMYYITNNDNIVSLDDIANNIDKQKVDSNKTKYKCNDVISIGKYLVKKYYGN